MSTTIELLRRVSCVMFINCVLFFIARIYCYFPSIEVRFYSILQYNVSYAYFKVLISFYTKILCEASKGCHEFRKDAMTVNNGFDNCSPSIIIFDLFL